MTEQRRQSELRRAVAELVAIEQQVAQTLARQLEVVGEHPDSAAVLASVKDAARDQAEALQGYLDQSENPEGLLEAHIQIPSALAGFTADVAPNGAGHAISHALREAYTAFNFAAMSYAMLFDMAVRLYDPTLRVLAPKHLRTYTRAAQTINQLVAKVVAWEMSHAGLGCHCPCPLCSIGACGCVWAGTTVLNATWRETAPAERERGIRVGPPKPGSQLAHIGVQGGDRLLAVDGCELKSIAEIEEAVRKQEIEGGKPAWEVLARTANGAIRTHKLGEEVRFSMQTGDEDAKDVIVKHAGDY